MVDELHQHGIVWRDVKADNVLVDMKGNLWIIDFGASYTHGWVDKSLAETVQRNLQGLPRIMDFLNPDAEGGLSKAAQGSQARERQDRIGNWLVYLKPTGKSSITPFSPFREVVKFSKYPHHHLTINYSLEGGVLEQPYRIRPSEKAVPPSRSEESETVI
ncbi:hypothetical protein AJ80_06483 [Polytolypa hystricis UAMH7299]|uniref:Protein kinase domain-containing protein n=1 Tax=Polytolypa hystricis (strain UAMH7299) TaxID=1447883 RepID=A0A2B7XVL6_POLH7|nr:hypothetical protein AJ80_06483 [Polytolypa hystricis UAMH7299]